jgi:hypothetical protein
MGMLIKKLIFTISATLEWYRTAATSYYLLREKKPVHILFCTVDHFEPSAGNVDTDTARERVDLLLSGYPRLADKHKDNDGFQPRRTWFFPPEDHRDYALKKLVSLCKKGYGEIELHLHHGIDGPDTPDNLEKTIRQCIKEYSHFGIFGTQGDIKKYAFIHGEWALDNSRNGRFCGVDNEIEILLQTGCFADFTFPSPIIDTNPDKINSIFYAHDVPDKPKSHYRGVRVKVNGQPRGGLMLIQGPFVPFFKKKDFLSFGVCGDGTTLSPLADNKLIDARVRTGICVEGKPHWIIIKTHTHGAVQSEAVLGNEMDQIFSYLESKYNDGNKYILHYVTARELYNIIKAAESDEPLGDPSQYRNYTVTPPRYDPSPDIPEASKELQLLIARTFKRGPE